MTDPILDTIIIILAILILVVGAYVIIDNVVSYNRIWNNGECQVCNEPTVPIGHAYTTEWYCPNCKRYNS